MADLVMTNGKDSLTVHEPTVSGVAALEHLGWEVASGDRPAVVPVEKIETSSVPPVVPGEVPAGNASREEWAAYAIASGIEVPEDAKRDDIKALVAAKEA